MTMLKEFEDWLVTMFCFISFVVAICWLVNWINKNWNPQKRKQEEEEAKYRAESLMYNDEQLTQRFAFRKYLAENGLQENTIEDLLQKIQIEKGSVSFSDAIELVEILGYAKNQK